MARGDTISRAIGVYHSGTTLEANGVVALGEGGSSHSSGLHILDSATVEVSGASLTGRDGNSARGIYVGTSATLSASGVTAVGEGGILNTDGLYVNAATTNIGASRLVGGASRSGGTLTCFHVFDANFAGYACP